MKFDIERSDPFDCASGVIHPLLGEAVTSFQAQAYKELLPANGPVKTQVVGEYNSVVEEQAQRVKEFMNYQITHVMEEYDAELDQLLFYLPLAGSAFKKVYYDEVLGRAVSKFVAPEDLIVPYYTTDLESCPRITNIIKMPENEVRKLQAQGFYRNVNIDYGVSAEESSQIKDEIEELAGLEQTYDSSEVTVLYEVHCNLDLDGFEDTNSEGQLTGVKLPYIVTIDSNSQQVLSIRRNYLEQDPYKSKIEYFVHFKFLPGLGFYGFGLTHMIGGLSKASTSILRQLIDAGTLANLPAGFKTRGIRIRDEDSPIQPGEFRDVDAPGGSLADAIQPLPFKEPSQTLLSLLSVLVNSGKQFASIAEINTGQGNPQAPVGTTMALLERSTKVLSAIHKRLHSAQRKEFKLLAKVFKEYLPPEYPYITANGGCQLKITDFDDLVNIIHISNPDIFNIMEHLQMKADAIAQTQMPPEAMAQYQQLQQASQQTSGQEQQQLVQQAAQILGQFSAPILAQLVSEFTETVSSPADEDPLVTIRKQELALKGQELAQEQRQFVADQERKIQESQARISVDRERIDASEDIARMKDDTAQDRLEQQRLFKSIDLQNK